MTQQSGTDVSEPASDASSDHEFAGEITVSSKIIDQLSSGLYESPAACLKELINNAYDADAREVNVSLRPDADLIIISDDGTGLNRDEFLRHFKRIARSYKRESGDLTKFGRPKIGKIGIGFIAANEICERLEIISTKEGSTEHLRVVLDFEEMRKDSDLRERPEGNVAKGDFKGSVTFDADKDSHYTRLLLSSVKGESRDFLNGAREGLPDQTLYGLSAESVRDKLSRSTMRTWDELDLYSRTVLEISENIPVSYHDDWAGDYEEELRDLTTAASDLDFTVRIDGTELRKPVVLRPDDHRTLLRRFRIEGKFVSAVGYMFSYDKKLNPSELNGLLVRIRNSAVGRYDNGYMDFPAYIAPLFQDWATVELYADDRLEDALNIDRKTLRVTHPAYVELQSELHIELTAFFNQVRRDIYGTRSAERKRDSAATQADKLRDFAERDLGLPPEVKEVIAATGRKIAIKERTDPSTLNATEIKALTRTYSPTEVLEMVKTAAAAAGISAADTERLLRGLLEKLQG